MTQKPQPPLFLEPDSYRQRRVRDVARVLPIVGGVLWLLPILWPAEGPDAEMTSSAAQYIFGIWLILIGITAMVSARIQPDPGETDGPG